MSVRHFSQKRLGKEPEVVGPSDSAALCDALRPLLRSMLGQVQGDKLVAELQAELK